MDNLIRGELVMRSSNFVSKQMVSDGWDMENHVHEGGESGRGRSSSRWKLCQPLPTRLRREISRGNGRRWPGAGFAEVQNETMIFDNSYHIRNSDNVYQMQKSRRNERVNNILSW